MATVSMRPELAPFLARYGTVLALLALIAFNFAFTPNFASLQTLNVNLTQVCTIVIVGVGMTLVIATGGIDLSVGSLMAIAGAVAPLIFLGKLFPLPHLYVGVALAFVVPVLVAGMFGLFNGWLITRFRIQPIIATLVLFIAGRGIAQVMTNGDLQVFKTPEFQFIGLGRVLGIPFQVLIMVVIVIVAAWVLQKTVFGRQVLATGGNEAAARLSGVPDLARQAPGLRHQRSALGHRRPDRDRHQLVERRQSGRARHGAGRDRGRRGRRHPAVRRPCHRDRHAPGRADHPARPLHAPGQRRAGCGGPGGQGADHRAGGLAAAPGPGMNAPSPMAKVYSALASQGVLVALVLLILFGWARYDYFLGSFNVLSVLRYNSMFALIALGMCFVIMTGGIDLSVGSTAAMASVVSALLSPYGLVPGLLGGVAAGAMVGIVNGLIVTRLGILPFIATLATMLAASGTGLLLADNQSVSVSYETGFTELGQGDRLGLPVPALMAAAAYLAGWVLLNYTAFGRYVLAVGGGEDAARLMGLPVDRVKFLVYALSGTLAGLAGVILAAQFGAGQPTEGIGWELFAIASVVVGGTLLTGGVGSVGATLAGALLLGLIFNILNFENGLGWISLSAYWQSVIRGAFLLLVVLLQSRLTLRST